ncbi:DUF4314 domain-containing protein [Schnuerera sp. xch1]|uniref:DUF4314 domain-containing protein n=1 Tax=Schnuerera sp. xch1 TaxID=2874283 RepID=UPI001CC00560|nr:DUF4314 domain-containing protein [Schnuerera sp. xch1]
MNNRRQIERIKERYPIGTRIELLSTMDDIQGVEKGVKGTVVGVDDIGTIHMKWDNGRGLGLIPGEDNFTVLSRPEENIQEEEISKNQGMGGMTL